MDNEKIAKEFESFQSKGYSDEDLNKVFDNEETVKEKVSRGPLKQFSEDVKMFYSMLKDTFSGKYTEIPKNSIVAMICTLIYLFSPIDIIPDFIPVIGLLDDVLIFNLCLKLVSSDVEKYKRYLENKVEINAMYISKKN